MSENRRYRPNPDVSCGHEEDGAVLFNPDTGETTMINLSGRSLWGFLGKGPRTVDEMAAHLVEAYRDVTSVQAAEDAREFIQILTPDFVQESNVDE